MSNNRFFTIIRFRLKMAINSLFLGEGKRGKLILILILGTGFIIGDYLFFRRLFIYFDKLPLEVGEILIIQLLAGLNLMLFSMLVFSNVISSLSVFYLSYDLEFLFSSPISMRDLFLARYLQSMINSSWMAFLFGLPVYVAYGQLYYAGSFYYLCLLPLIFLFVIPPACIGVLLTVLLLRFFPAKRSYQILSFAGIVLVGGLVLLLRFLKPEKYLGVDVPEEAIIDFVDRLKTPDSPWLPSSLFSGAIQAGAYSDWQLFLEKSGLLFLFSAGFLLVAGYICVQLYYHGFTASGGSREKGKTSDERFIYRLVRKISAFLRIDNISSAIVLKDIKLFWRDTGQWSQIFMLTALVAVYLFNIRNLPLDTFFLKNVVSVMNIGLAGIVLSAVCVRFVFPTTSIEGKSYWLLRSAPVGYGRFLWTKFFLYLFPLLFMAEVLVIVSNLFLGVDGFVMTVSAIGMALLATGLVGLGVGLGALYPLFDYESVAEVGTSTGAVIYMIVSLIYAGLCVILLSRPVYVHLVLLHLGRDEGGPEVYLSYIGYLLLSFGFIFWPMNRGIKALERIEI